MIQSPLRMMVFVLSGPARGLVTALDALRAKREAEDVGSTPEAAAVPEAPTTPEVATAPEAAAATGPEASIAPGEAAPAVLSEGTA